MRSLQFLLSVLTVLFVNTLFAQDNDFDEEVIDAWINLKPREKIFTAEMIVPIRTVEKDGLIDELQTAVCTYEKDDVNLQVIGTVHVADVKYYQMLNERFKKYDALLYELVAPEGKKPKKDERTVVRNIVNVFLDLDHQLSVIDYEADNFVHADFTPEKFQAAMEKHGDTMVTIALSTIADLMRQYKKQKGLKEDVDVEATQIIGNPNAAVELKRMMAKQFVESDDLSAGFGSVLKTYILDERNIEALKVVEEHAKTDTKIGLYYGAAHLPDFDVRLRELGWNRTNIEYDTAWAGLSKNQDELEHLSKLLQGLKDE